MQVKMYFLLALVCTLCQSPLPAQLLSPGPQVTTFHSDIDDTEQPYGLYIPKNYNPKKKYPLVVMLHGAGSNHRLALRRVFGRSNENGENDVETSRVFPAFKDVNYIVVTPFARGTMGYQGIAEKDVMDVVADVKKRFLIDEDRTYLTGLSMGGGGSMWIGLSYPDMWAAIAPVCPAPPEGTLGLMPNGLNIPMRFFQGTADPAVNVDSTRLWIQRLKDAGVQVAYDEYPGVQHDSWVNAYKDAQIFDWFGQYKRNRFPDHVRFATATYQHNKAYWVTLDAITPGTTALLDAQLTGKNRLTITTQNLSGFTLQLAGHPGFAKNKDLIVNLNGTVITLKSDGVVSFSEKGGKWFVAPFSRNGLMKGPGAEGPMTAALASRHVYVYGTGGNPSKEEQERRRQEALKASEWSYYRGEFLGRIQVFPRTLSDKEVRESDLNGANLILFGTKETNTLITKFADYLPLQLSADPSEYGLVYIFPTGNHYVVVNSGIPVWESPEITNNITGLSRFTTPPFLLGLKKFGDYAVYSKKEVIAHGRFDHNWQLPEEVAGKLRKSGVVGMQ
jgi:predicted esterase